MIQDFEQDDSPARTDADVCLVGAGAAGIALALTLSRSGLSVALVESGGLTPGETDQSLNSGKVDGGACFTGLREGRARSLGGSTKLWYGQCIRYEAIDFEARPWVRHSGWPLTLADLEPFYQQAEEFFAISGEVYDESIYDHFNLPRPLFDETVCKTHFTIYSPQVDLGGLHQKALKESKTITVLLHANVTEVLTNDAGTKALGVRIQSLNGRKGLVCSRVVVLCAGGIENPRLLLLSNRVKAKGLGNERDLVGRFFQDHPNGQSASLKTSTPALVGEVFSLLYNSRLRYFPKLALSARLQTLHKVSNCNGHFVFEYPEYSGIAAAKTIYRSLRRGEKPAELSRNLRSILGDLPQTLLATKRFFVDRKSPLGSPSRIRFQCYLEQEPDPDSRVQLAEERDALGLPLVKISWKINEAERRTIAAATVAVGLQISRLGFGEFLPDSWLNDPEADWRSHLSDAYHHIGTTRMASSPATGVVDRNCEVFGVAGLYAAGSSVFPTSGYGNPTLTLVALAYRLADHLRSTLS